MAWGFVARRLQTHFGVCALLAPRPRPFWAQRNTSYLRDTTLAVDFRPRMRSIMVARRVPRQFFGPRLCEPQRAAFVGAREIESKAPRHSERAAAGGACARPPAQPRSLSVAAPPRCAVSPNVLRVSPGCGMQFCDTVPMRREKSALLADDGSALSRYVDLPHLTASERSGAGGYEGKSIASPSPRRENAAQFMIDRHLRRA